MGGVRKGYGGIIRDENGNNLTTEQQQKERWSQYFENLLNCEEPAMLNEWDNFEQEFLAIDTSPFTIDEVNKARNALKNNKCPGEDLITSEMLKAFNGNNINRLKTLYNEILDSECVPAEWKREEV